MPLYCHGSSVRINNTVAGGPQRRFSRGRPTTGPDGAPQNHRWIGVLEIFIDTIFSFYCDEMSKCFIVVFEDEVFRDGSFGCFEDFQSK